MNDLRPKPLVLIILDGWGIAPPGPGNAIELAKTPNMDYFWENFPHAKLFAAGEWVGLLKNEDGTTSVGHLNIGAGRIVKQDLPRINMSIADGSFFQNQALKNLAYHVKKNNSAVHLLGLVGRGMVHSSLDHLFALLRFCKENQLDSVWIHAFTDGRDTLPTSAEQYITEVEEEIKKIGVGKIASVGGRYYAMDRNMRYERIQKAYEALVTGKGYKAKSSRDAIAAAYGRNETDEFISPTLIIDENNQPLRLIADNDGVIFFNFRADRPRELTEAFVLPDFETMELKKPEFDPYSHTTHIHFEEMEISRQTFKRSKILKNLYFVTMTLYKEDLPVEAVFPLERININLTRILAMNGLKQLHMAESEKERFVTFYFNGFWKDRVPDEEWLIVPSPKVPAYDLKPEMASFELTAELLENIRSNKYDFIVVNFAGADMVGHTGKIPATIKACQAIDECLGKISREVLKMNGCFVITADHGNAEEMIGPGMNSVDTKHSLNPVPFIVLKNELKGFNKELSMGILADIAPTILFLLKIEKPEEMTGRNLLSWISRLFLKQ